MAQASVKNMQSQGGDFAPPAAGAYSGIIAACVDSKESFEGKPPKDVTKLIFQIKDQDGKPQFVRGPGLTLSLHEKSGLFKMLSGWLRTKDTKAIIAALEKAGVITEIAGDQVFLTKKLVGRRVGLLLSEQESKGGRAYAKIEGYTQPQDKTAVIIPAKLPAFFVENAIDYTLADGITCDLKPGAGADVATEDTAADVNLSGIIDSL